MEDKVVELKAGRRASDHMPEAGPWFGPLDARISQIERTLDRLEWQVWIVLCGVVALLVFAIAEKMKLV